VSVVSAIAARWGLTDVGGDYYLIPMHVPPHLLAGPEDTHALQISTPAGFVLGPPGTKPADLGEHDRT
jgi:hypothetical protein